MIKLPIVRKFTLVLVLLIVLFFSGAYFAYSKLISKPQQESEQVEEIELTFDAEGPYALLFPRRDGNALVLNLKRTASYDKISYELAYNAEGIDRGVMGDINTGEKRGEYEQEILFGTCSKNVCKYDKGVENGTLTLHIRKGKLAYRMITQWHLQKPDVALGKLSSGDGHFNFKVEKDQRELSLIQYTIINDLSGAPKLPSARVVVGKVYGLNTPQAKILPKGKVSFEVASPPPEGSKIAYFDEAKNQWVELDTKISGSTLEASVPQGGIFATLSTRKSP